MKSGGTEPAVLASCFFADNSHERALSLPQCPFKPYQLSGADLSHFRPALPERFALAMIISAAPSSPPPWQRGKAFVMSVDSAKFVPYNLSVMGRSWLSNGTVSISCGNHRYAADSGDLTPVGLPVLSNGSGTAGNFEAIMQRWAAGSCAQLTTSVRYYPQVDAFEFLLTTGARGVENASTSPVSTRRGYRGRSLACNVSTEFPSFELPTPRAPPGIGLAYWDGAMLFGPAGLLRPASDVASADMSAWHGGLANGPLLFFSNASSSLHPPAALLGPSDAFKVGILARRGERVVGGAQGMVNRLPAGYTLRFALAGSAEGVTAAALAWGSYLQRAHSTIRKARLTLEDDVLSRRLHYVTDGGAAENYCDYWPACINSTSACTPMHATLTALQADHARLDLGVSLYHLDPFWWSHEPYGGCKLGASAQSLAASPFHFPQGLAALGLPGLQLILKFFSSPNEYSGSYRFDGLGVSGADSARFWGALLPRLRLESNARALVWDGLDFTWLSSDSRVNNTHEQEQADAGLADEALRQRLPIRVDTATPADVLASVQRGAVTAQRVTGDANPHDWFEESNWVQLGDNSLLVAALGVRPMADVLWSTPTQPADPRWRADCRKNVRHDLTLAVLSCGPVGFGDVAGGSHTDATLLHRATRAGGIILRPAHPLLRLDRWFTSEGGAEIRAAVSGPAGGVDARVDARANAMAQLHDASTDANAVWWWSILSTNVDGTLREGRPLSLSELWPTPSPQSRFFVAALDERAGDQGSGAGAPQGAARCAHGASASSCLVVWDHSHPLNLSTAAGTALRRSFRLLGAAPILSTGWALLGELGKVVPVSPQRFVAPGDGEAPRDTDLLLDGGGLKFIVLGSPGEVVTVTLAAPSPVQQPAAAAAAAGGGSIVVLTVRFGPSQSSALVSCRHSSCNASATAPRGRMAMVP